MCCVLRVACCCVACCCFACCCFACCCFACCFYTQTLFHTEAFTHRSFYTQTILDTNTFTDRRFYTDGFTHRPAHAHMRKGSRDKRDDLTSQFYLCFWRSNLISCERVATRTRKSQFFLSFWRSDLISCERRRTPGNIDFISIFADRTSFRAKGLRGTSEIAILPQFLTIESHFVRKGCAGQVEIAILLQFLTIEPHFVRKGCAGQVKSQFYFSF